MKIAFVLFLAALAASCWSAYRPHTYRYKLTVEVQTPDGPRVGTAVHELKVQPQPKMAANEFTTEMRGEAVAVDLPNGETLFALLDVGGTETVAATFMQGRAGNLKSTLDQAKLSNGVYLHTGAKSGPRGNPVLLRFAKFADTNNPLSVEDVDPDNLEASFGAPYKLLGISAQMTDALK